MNNEEIKAMLRAAGIPRDVFTTTLTREGYVDIKDWVASPTPTMAYVTEYPSLRSVSENKYLEHIQSAETLFYLIAKEFALLGANVYCCDLMDLHSLWIGQDAEEVMYQRMADSTVLCVRGFYERTPTPLTSYESHRIASRLTGLSRDGTRLVLLGASTQPDSRESLSSWWPPSLAAYIKRTAIHFEAKP